VTYGNNIVSWNGTQDLEKNL